MGQVKSSLGIQGAKGKKQKLIARNMSLENLAFCLQMG